MENRLTTIMNNVLDEKQRKVITLRFGLDGYSRHTLQQIANDLKRDLGREVTRERVRQIEAKALHLIRKEIKDENIELEDLL